MGVDFDAGGTRVAMSDNPQRTGAGGIVRYFVTDHLGSTTKLINSNGTIYSNLELDYQSWGVDDLTPAGYATTFKYTGQRHAAGAQSGAEAGLYFYNARWRGAAAPRSVPAAQRRGFDPEVGRFIQADTLIPEPGNPLAWDRYAYANNNPLYYTDPSGHSPACMDTECWKKYGEYAKTQSTKPIIARSSDYPLNNNTQQQQWNDCGPWAASREGKNKYQELYGNFPEERYMASGGGIQPSELEKAARSTFGNDNVSVTPEIALFDLYLEVYFDKTAVTDIVINKSSGSPGNQQTLSGYAHFARVVSVDLTNESITLVNSLYEGTGGTWNLSWNEYKNASNNPERLTTRPYEKVNQWWLILSNEMR
jgi:RHS repeat-associated protein